MSYLVMNEIEKVFVIVGQISFKIILCLGCDCEVDDDF